MRQKESSLLLHNYMSLAGGNNVKNLLSVSEVSGTWAKLPRGKISVE